MRIAKEVDRKSSIPQKSWNNRVCDRTTSALLQFPLNLTKCKLILSPRSKKSSKNKFPEKRSQYLNLKISASKSKIFSRERGLGVCLSHVGFFFFVMFKFSSLLLVTWYNLLWIVKCNKIFILWVVKGIIIISNLEFYYKSYSFYDIKSTHMMEEIKCSGMFKSILTDH